MRKEYINKYFDLLREEAGKTDWSGYAYPDLVYSNELEKIEAARERELKKAEDEHDS